MTSQPNWPLPTLGGKQFWADLRWFADWRIQQNVVTGHCRLLDDHDVRRAWGSLAACEAELADARKEHGLRLHSDHLVVLLHGLGRSRSSLNALRSALHEAGYEVAALTYPSTRRSIQEHAAQIDQVLDHLDGISQVSFVTHSLGGMIARTVLASDAAWHQHLSARRLVMLAPPSQGSAIAESLQDFLPAQWLLGPAARDLALSEAAQVPAPTIPFAVIAGRRGEGKGYNPFLKGEDDGVVRVEEAWLEGTEDFLVLQGLHTFLMSDPLVIQAVIGYLKEGSFGEIGDP